ncbi:hypothetical protein [Streptomyces sp. NPDC059894]|uniref:hypothetical protein n=1 Tax=unclassified Streptomyces TaxID=2593676 RepID=UPI0036576846
MASRALAQHSRRDAPLRPAGPADGRPSLLLVGDDGGDPAGWARRGIERRYRLLSPPAGGGSEGGGPAAAAGVVTFQRAAVDRALRLAERSGLPTAALRTAALSRSGTPRRSAPADGSAPGPAWTVVVVCAVLDGRPSPLFAARPEREGEDTGYVVEASDPLLHRRDVIGAVLGAHRGLDIRAGLTATEVGVVGRDGGRPAEWVGVEGLLGADPLLRAGSLATGVDCALAWADLAAGAAPDLTPRRRSAAAVRLTRPGRELALEPVELDVSALPGGIWEVHLGADRDGEGHAPARPVVLAVSVGEDAAACRRALDLLPGALRVRHRPPPPLTEERNRRRTHV